MTRFHTTSYKNACGWYTLQEQWHSGHNETLSIPLQITICFQSSLLSLWHQKQPTSQYANTCYCEYSSGNHNVLMFGFYTKNGQSSSEELLTLSPAARRIQHILVSDQHCALEGEVDRDKKRRDGIKTVPVN